MSRYFTRPRARLFVEDETFKDEGPMIVSVSVSEHVATDTGLLDVNGDAIMRSARPVGFGRDAEW